MRKLALFTIMLLAWVAFFVSEQWRREHEPKPQHPAAAYFNKADYSICMIVNPNGPIVKPKRQENGRPPISEMS